MFVCSSIKVDMNAYNECDFLSFSDDMLCCVVLFVNDADVLVWFISS